MHEYLGLLRLWLVLLMTVGCEVVGERNLVGCVWILREEKRESVDKSSSSNYQVMVSLYSHPSALRLIPSLWL